MEWWQVLLIVSGVLVVACGLSLYALAKWGDQWEAAFKRPTTLADRRYLLAKGFQVAAVSNGLGAKMEREELTDDDLDRIARSMNIWYRMQRIQLKVTAEEVRLLWAEALSKQFGA